MQDRFKFRVWEKDQKIMKECTQITLDKDQKGSMCDVKGKVTAHLIFQPHYILMQCTGKKDKNDKLIYENDIVYKKGSRDYKGNKLYSQVIWDSMYSRFVISDDNGIHNIPTNSANVEIVGNIYENGELLNYFYNENGVWDKGDNNE